MKRVVGLMIVLNLMFFFKDAFAYLDPGTGSYLLQILIAALAGSFFAIKMKWQSIKMLFSKKKDSEKKDS